MSIIDKVIAAVTPPETDNERAEARAKARQKAGPGSWLEAILQHHLAIESAFAAVKSAGSATARMAAQKQLASLLIGHSSAEEAVVYPGLALHGEKAHAEKAYLEQSMAKIQMAALEDLEPMSQDYLDKLGHIEGAVLHHVYEEEGEWFPDLYDKADEALHRKLGARYLEEFNRYSQSATLQTSRPPSQVLEGTVASSLPSDTQRV